MGDFLQHNAVSLFGLLITLGTLLIHIGVSKQKLASVSERLATIDLNGSQYSKLLDQRVSQHQRELAEVRSDQHSYSRDLVEMKVLLSSVTTKIDSILKSVETLTKEHNNKP